MHPLHLRLATIVAVAVSLIVPGSLPVQAADGEEAFIVECTRPCAAVTAAVAAAGGVVTGGCLSRKQARSALVDSGLAETADRFGERVVVGIFDAAGRSRNRRGRCLRHRPSAPDATTIGPIGCCRIYDGG